MKQRIITFLFFMTMPFVLFGQSYDSLWKKVKEAENKDLPKTQYEILQQIVTKATKDKAYGQLLKAELESASVMAGISPDSLKPAMERMVEATGSTKDLVLKTVYQTVLYRICSSMTSLEMNAEKPVLDEVLCRQLAQVRDETYEPFVLQGTDSRLFNHDLLSVIGYELRDYYPLYSYYEKTGNRPAACVTAAKVYSWNTEKLDSLMTVYGDLPEAGELAIARYNLINTTEEKIHFADEALRKWGGWKRMNILRNEEKELTNPQYHLNFDCQVNQPMQEMKIQLESLRNISSLTVKVYRVKANGDIDIRPDYQEGYKKIKSLLVETPVKFQKQFQGKKPYELFEDSLILEGLPVGVYMLEFSTNPSTEVVRRLYYVTDLYTMAESQPDGRIRYVVVNATTGQPIPGAHLRIRQYISYNKYSTSDVRTDSKGEYIFEANKSNRCEVFAYTDDDKACPDMDTANRYRYHAGDRNMQRTSLFADRSIYRPGQTVHVAAMVYDVEDGYKFQTTEGKRLSFTLRDANWKEVKTIGGITDEYGMCTADFTLPSSGLTGRYTIQAGGTSLSIRVEEYKRPTFEVEFPEVRQHYEAGDTVAVRAMARTYAGVPVQGAVVKYKVIRRMAFWWWSYWRYYDSGYIGIGNDDEDICSGETLTDSQGEFSVAMPMTIPESDHPLFYNFILTADVTDAAGETHSGQMSLPLGNRKTALSIDLPRQVLLEDNPQVAFHLRNAAGKDIDAQVSYRIDEGKWLTARTTMNYELLTMNLRSGRHTLEAVCGTDTLKRQFVVFSLSDKRPATDTRDWFYQSSSQFPNDGTPVTIQVGSSDKDVHILYSIFSGNRLLESGSTDKSNALINRKFTYRDDYGNGIVLNYAWVKNGHCYTHTAQIQRPLPDRKLQLQWTTFRDRLTPGQQEQWTLTVKRPDGKPADAMLTATLYDKSLDQLQLHQWQFYPSVWLPLPSVSWTLPSRYPISEFAQHAWSRHALRELSLSHFDSSVFPSWQRRMMMRGSRVMRSAMAGAVASAPVMDDAVLEESAAVENAAVAYGLEKKSAMDSNVSPGSEESGNSESVQVQVRENLNETAFFYPQLTTDAQGCVALKFTLPESLTTWRFMGLAHTRDMYYGMLEGEAIAQKDVMVQPNMPRFIREGDEATITARIFNLCDREVQGTALLRLLDPESDKVVYESSQPFSLAKDSTTATASFPLNLSLLTSHSSLLVCQVLAVGDGFSDGEQHYLPVLPSSERVTVTVPFTQNEPGIKTIDLASLIPVDGKDGKLTVEYSNNPAWLMVQALPVVGKPIDDNAISQTASYYANSIGKYIMDQNPKVKTVFDLWQKETGNETSLMSALEKNQDLKELVLNETPWVLDADRESEQKQRMADFFDANTMQMRLSSSLEKMRNLQRADGGWSWWPDMPGSFYMTVAVSEMLVRLNALTEKNYETSTMLDKAFGFMGKEVIDIVKNLKKWEKKGHKPSFPSMKALQWLYLCTLDGRSLPSDVQAANDYLMPLLKKDIKNQSIYEKALTAVILSKTDPDRSREYVKSLKEYTVYREEMGRYYDTPRAGYSWFDYKIPTQTMAIEALQRLIPEDKQTIQEMQRWLLQAKRTQAWDTPINSVNAVYAFLNGSDRLSNLNSKLSTISVDDKTLETTATAGIGYVKSVVPVDSKKLSVEKTSDGTSWGAVYAQFTQPTKNIADHSSGLKVTREILGEAHKVGDRITVRIIIEADRDYDFVQVIDKRAACMEPVKQLSGYHSGSYCTPRDNSTNYYFNILSKGKHVIETEYYIDRVGTYETGTCTVQCAYAPEFHGTTKSQTIIVK